MTFPANLKRLRKAKGLYQDELSIEAEMTPKAVAYYETSRRKPGLDNIIKLCRALECEPNDLIEIEGEL